MTPDNWNTLLFVFVALAGIQALSTYALLRLVLTGRSMFDRREDADRDHDRPTIHRVIR